MVYSLWKTYLLKFLINDPVKFLFSFFYKITKDILYNFIQLQQYNFEWRQTVILYIDVGLKNISVKKYFDCWSLSMSDFLVTFTTCYLRISNTFFLKRRKQVISWNCFFVKRFPDTFLNDFAFVSSLFLFLYWTQLVNRLLTLFCSFCSYNGLVY